MVGPFRGHPRSRRSSRSQLQSVTRPVLFISFLDYWQVTLIWSPYGDDSLIRPLLIGDTSTTYYTDVVIGVTMTLYEYVFLLTHAQLTVVTQNCALLCITDLPIVLGDSGLRITVHYCAL